LVILGFFSLQDKNKNVDKIKILKGFLLIIMKRLSDYIFNYDEINIEILNLEFEQKKAKLYVF